MTDMRGLPRKYERQLIRARARLTVVEEVGLALREHRRRLGMNQRTYAAHRGLSRTMVARLEAGSEHLGFDTVVRALRGTGFELRVAVLPSPPDAPEGAGQLGRGSGAELPGAVPDAAVPPEAWEPTDLIARVRGGSRRFPAHRPVRAVVNPPIWWWMHEFFSGPSEEPQWYAPVHPPNYGHWRPLSEERDEREDDGAA